MKKNANTMRVLSGLFAATVAIGTAPVNAQDKHRLDGPNAAQEDDPKAAAIPRPRSRDEVRRRQDPPPPEQQGAEMAFPVEFRTIDGHGNNVAHPEWGAAEQTLLRMIDPAYADDSGEPAGANRPGAREISNAVAAQSESVPNRHGASDYLWQWGQFLDHDIDETPAFDPPEAFNIPVPAGDPWFDPRGSGAVDGYPQPQAVFVLLLDQAVEITLGGLGDDDHGLDFILV